jgi:4'-phosphopantetheinyl transferase EntD
MPLDPPAAAPNFSGLNETWIGSLFDPRAVTLEATPAIVDDQLYPEELAAISRAVPKRRAEFGTARVCARRALAGLGIEAQSLAPNPDRSPRWPADVVGSISHTARYCAVVVARPSVLRSVGLDVEVDRELEPGIIEMICTERERRALADPARDAIVYFSAKEAFYKCQYPLTRSFLGFQEVELDVDYASGTFQVRLLRKLQPAPPAFDHIQGRFLREHGLVLSGFEMLAPSP